VQLSVVIPAHNEAEGIESQVTGFLESLPKEVADSLLEIIIVENGSKDETLEICHKLQQGYPDLLRIVTIARGSYGEAIKTGMLESKGTHITILECDFLDKAFVSKSIALFQAKEAAVIVGSKRHPASVDRRPLMRRILTALYNLVFLRLMIGYTGTDTHGLKSFESLCAKKLCDVALTTDEVFQTEIVLLAWRLGMKIQEVPVTIAELRGAPVSVVRRLPKVIYTVRQLKQSLSRFSSPTGTDLVGH
jgi:glycosyltransferase involved in cell wall biosynthesis